MPGQNNKGAWSMTRYRNSIALLMATSAIGMAGAANAQSAAAQTVAADVPANGEIIVTATKRSESIQKVPISMQALSPLVLEQHQVQSFDDYAKLLPSVSYQSFGPGQTQLYFRGISTGGDGLHAGPLPATGLYIDETPVTTVAGSVDIHVYDMARVEALAGPQGTLYGASSLSGTLRLITNKPDTSKFYGGFDLEGNKFGSGGYGGQAEGFVNIPLSDRAAIRLVGFYTRDGGFIDNTAGSRTYQRPHTVAAPTDEDPDATAVANAPLTVNNAKFVKNNFNDVKTYGGRAALKFDLDDNWTVTPAAIYQHQVANGTFLYDPNVGDLKVHDFTPDRNTDHWYLASLTVQGKISNWDVTYSGSFFQRTVDNTQDYSYFTVAYYTYTDYNLLHDAAGHDIDPTQTFHGNDHYKKMSHELRINSPADERFRLTAGLFMQRQTDDQIAEYIIPGVRNAVDAFDPPVPGGGPDDVYYTTIHRVDRDYAMFGEAAYDILPNLTLNAGIRGFIAKNTLAGFSGGVGAISATCAAGTVQGCPNIDAKYVGSGETHKLNLTWQIDRDKMVYATYSTGFRPGGNNRISAALGQTQAKPPFVADTLTNYEIGWKTSWLDHSLRVNGAVFWENWNKIQYSLPGLLGIYYTLNAGDARSRGIEGDVSWTIAHHLTLSASGTYVDAKLTTPFLATNKDGSKSVAAPKGTRLPVQPKLKINATARYDFETGTLKDFVQGSVNHQSGTLSYLTTAGEDVLGPTKGFTTFDFSAGTAFGNTTLSIFIQNAFDKRGILSKNSVCTPGICGAFARLYPIKPQLFGIKLGEKF
jgi:iron complex outermembrane receptor protein